jgi:hypothetical protein
MKGKPSPLVHNFDINNGSSFIIPLLLLLIIVNSSLIAQSQKRLYSADPAFQGIIQAPEAGNDIKNPVAAFALTGKVMGTAAVTNPMIDSEESGTFELGCEFTIPFPITITELGLYDIGADGITDPTR